MIDLEKLTREIRETSEEHTVSEAIAALNSSGKKAMSWKNLDKYVLENAGYFWSGLFITHAEEGAKLGETVKFDEHTFEVPKQFQDTDDQHALIISHEHLDVLENNTLRLKEGHEEHVKVENFHRKHGYYAVNDWGFPNGAEAKSDDKDSRYFYSRNSGAYIGLLARDGDGIDRRGVYALLLPSDRLGVLLE